MLEESLPAIWASMNSWFTPTVLFIFLNLMIGTIAVASGLGNQNQPQQQQQNEDQQKRLDRVPSRLERLKSMNFYRFGSEISNPFPSITTTILNPPSEPETHHTQEQIVTQEQIPTQEPEEEEEEEEEEFPEKTLDEVYTHHVTRTVSDTKPYSGAFPVKLPQKMKKSASSKSAFAHFEEEEIVVPVRPSTVREGKTKSGDMSFGDDEEVDAKADDFINKFKQQLKLQRLDSILRYKETLKRG